MLRQKWATDAVITDVGVTRQGLAEGGASHRTESPVPAGQAPTSQGLPPPQRGYVGGWEGYVIRVGEDYVRIDRGLGSLLYARIYRHYADAYRESVQCRGAVWSYGRAEEEERVARERAAR